MKIEAALNMDRLKYRNYGSYSNLKINSDFIMNEW